MKLSNVKCLNQELSSEFAIYNGDSVELMKAIPDNSIHYTIFSPPFASLYTYSASDRDMGNSKTFEEFSAHFGFLVKDLLRTTIPGRLMSFHCMDLPLSKERDGIIGLRDFRGILIRAAERMGWVLHSQVVIWKDPVTAMQRTKAIGLLNKQLLKDSAMSRQGIPDYLVTMRKPGLNPEPVTNHETFKWTDYVGEDAPEKEEYASSADPKTRYSIAVWQRYASPVWFDISAGDTLQRESAREEADERHICPLQLGVIRRALRLWTNPNDIVLSPFAGIGSEGYVALQEGRRFVGCELKESYYRQAVLNLKSASSRQGKLFE